MGYQITFVPTEEKMKEYKPWNVDDKNYEPMEDVYRRELVSYCMKNEDDSTMKHAKQIKFLLRCLVSAIEQDEKRSAYMRWLNDENHEVWYCGWEFAQDHYTDIDETVEQYIDDLLIFADMVDTPNYFKEGEDFYSKLTEVRERVDGFIEVIRTAKIHDIINDLDEFKKTYDDSEDE